MVDNPALLPNSRVVKPVESACSGFVQGINAFEAGMAAKMLGTGRQTKADAIDLSIGILLKKKVGDPVERGEPLAHLFYDGDEAKVKTVSKRLLEAYTICPNAVAPTKLILARVTADNFEEID